MRRFEAAVFDWDEAAVPHRRSDAGRVRELVEALCAVGFNVAIVSDSQLGNVDSQLAARPDGPGRLYLCLNRGSEVFAVGPAGPELIRQAESGLTDTSDSAHWVLDELGRRGLAASAVLFAGEAFGAVAGVAGSVVARCGGLAAFADILEDQLRRRDAGELPWFEPESDWTIRIDGLDPRLERAHTRHS